MINPLFSSCAIQLLALGYNSGMEIQTHTIQLQTGGEADIQDITRAVADAVNGSGLQNGIVTIFCPSATSALTTLEYESGCIQDLQRLFDELLPPDRHYAHNARWGDGNGHSHARAALLGPSLTVPFVVGRLTLGTWQQIIHLDFDNRSRRRELVVQIMGAA
jgi:secondary thiamine-phosphate synthase enzyme